MEILRADVAEAETSQVVRPAQIKSVENRDGGNTYRKWLGNLHLIRWGACKNPITVDIKDLTKKAGNRCHLGLVPDIDRGRLDVDQKDQVSRKAPIFGCFDVESVNLLISAQWASGNVRRDRNSLAFSG